MRNNKVFSYAGMILLVACSAADQTAPVVRSAEEAGVQAMVYPTYSEDRKSADVVVTPSGGWFSIGVHGVWFPANSICDPALTTYGPTEWDKPCTTISSPITIHAEIKEQDGLPYVVFTPDLRFAPATRKGGGGLDPKKFVNLYMYVGGSSVTDAGAFEIKWVADEAAAPVSEDDADVSLQTKRMARGQVLYRRVKHFSGYLVAAGIDGDRDAGYDAY
jgi:hypothetical protein